MATQKFEPFSGKLDAATEFEPFDGTLDGEPAKPASAARKLADLGLGFASGAVGATKALTDVAGAGNKASKVLADLNTGINDYLSPEAKADQQEQGRIMSDAGGKGVWEGVKAGAKAFAVAPVQTAVQGLGSVVPIVAGTALTGGAAPAAAVGAGMGVAMGAGTAKGAIYDEIKKRGGTEEQAIRAQEYGGSNTDQIALGGALGVVDALTGVSKAASGVVRGALGKPVAQAATQAAERGIVSRAGMGMLGEMPLEAAQGGQEQVAANLAAQRAGYEAGTWDNVASNATMEALASAGPGAAFGAMDTGNKQTPPPPPPPAPQPDQPAPPAGLLGNTPDPLISFPDGTVGRRSEVDAYVASLPEDQQPAMRARLMGLAPQPAIPAASEAPVVEPVAPPSVQMGIDPSNGPLSRAAATAVDTGIAQEIEFNQATAEDQAAYDQAMAAQEQARAEQDSVDKPITSGAIAESQMSEADRRAVLFSNKYVEDGGARHVGTLDGDVLNGMGAPFATRLAAARRAKMEGKDWTIAPVFDGWVARRKDAIDGASDGVRGSAAGSSEQGSDQPAPGVGLGATDGNGVGTDARGRADDAVGESLQSSGGVDDAAVEQLIIQPEKQEQPTSALPEQLSNSEQKDNEVAKTPQPSAALSPYQQKIADAKSNGDTEVALKWGDFEVRQSATNGNPDFAVVQTSSGKVVAKGLGSVETAAIIASGRADAGQGAGVSQPTQTAPAWWTERSDDERQMLLKLSGFKNANADWSKMTDDQRSTIGKHYAELESGETQNQKLKKSDLDHLFGVDQKRTKALDRIAAGKAWFSNPMKAADFITKNGLKVTHKSVRTGPKRWDVQSKESEENATLAPANTAQAAINTVAHTEREVRIASALANGGHVVGTDLRDRTGMRLLGLTAEELKTIPADKVRAKPSAEAARTNSTTKGNEDGTQAPQTQQAEAQQPQERTPGQPVAESLPPTDIKVGDTVLVDGKPYKVSQGIQGGIAVESEPVGHGSGVSNTTTKFLKGDDAIRAKIEADKAGLNEQLKPDDKPNLKKTQAKRKAAIEAVEAEEAKTQAAARADYFTPGNIVKSYGGHDEVLAYNAPTSLGGRWSVRVHAVEQRDGKWVRQGRPQDAREHSTQPEPRNLAAGPVVRLPYQPAAEVQYSEARGDGKPFSNAVDRGAKPTGEVLSSDQYQMRNNGARAHASGRRRVPPSYFAASSQKEWLAGWDAANAAAPVAEAKQDAPVAPKPEIVVDKAEMRPYRKPDGSVGYEAVPISEEKTPQATADKAQAATETVAKPDAKAALSEKEKAAKAKMFNALGKLATLAGKNARMNWTQEEEQQLLPIVIELFDGAMELGAVSFQQAVAYVRDFITTNLDSETADAIPFDTLQGAYISVAGRHKDKPVTPKKEVVGYESLDELALAKPAASADTPTEDTPNEPANPNQQDPQALEPVPATEDRGPESSGRVERGSAGRRARRKPDDSGLAEPGVSGTRSGGSGSTTVRAPAPRAGKRGRLGESGAGANGSAVPEAGSTQPVDLFSAPTEPVSAGNIQATNFRITEDLRLGQGGEAEKFRDNLAAIRTLKAIESEGRRATSEEQRTLARYVGWGGLSSAFPNPESKAWKDDWKTRGAELRELLTDKEYDLARRSTLDSHYTSQTVVNAMWDAARRLGFKGGLAAETSMGIGNFMGLMPEDVAGNTRFVGVEYDSLTARMAGLLYPQATVLHSGLQKVPMPDGAFDLNIGNPPFGDQSLRFQFKPEINRVSIHNQFFLAGVDALKPGGLQINVVSRYLLDAMDKTTRTMLAKKAKLVAAIRLPDTAFKENARTSVVTDIVILQRLTPAEESNMQAVFEAYSTPFKADKGAAPWVVADKKNKHDALVAQVPAWVEVAKVPDPLGGDAIPVNSYFAANPGNILGTLERSGKMQFKNDITVRPGAGELSELLAKVVERLPEGIMQRDQDAIQASIARHKGLSDALRISLSGQEAGSIALTPDGGLEQVYERETPEGDYELAKRAITPQSPWSEALFQDATGAWYTIEAKLDADGKPEKVIKSGKATNLNVYERKVFAREVDIPEGMRLGQAKFDRLAKLVKLRDLMVNQISLETEDAPTLRMEGNRKKLAAAYKDFVDTEGFISKPANSALVANMPDGALVQALELSYRKAIGLAQAKKMGEKARPEQADPAPILTERVIPKYEPPTKASTPADALSIVMSESGRVDIERMASLLGKTEAEVTADMFDNADKPLIFKDPETSQWMTRNEYLTGQVKKKLHAAQAAGLQKHITELEAVQPEPWGAENVTVLLGATFVPPKIYADFILHMTGAPAKVSFSQVTNSYSVSPSGNATAAKQDEWGAEGISIANMISAMLNSTGIKVTTTDADDNTVVDKERTELANLKARQIASEFTDWAFADGQRRKTLVGLFNEKYNTRVNRQHDGSHLTLPGKVPDAIISMRRHQKNAIWRGISERFMLLDHVVGAGKTFTAIARAMERRRMGLSRKPAIIVPNHMVEQFTSDVYRLYPGAKVLAAGKADFEKKRRRKVFAKIASGDWDVVIIPHSSFGFIGIAPETEERYLEQELVIAEQAIKDAWEESDDAPGGRRTPFNVKQAERLRDKITARMEGLRGKDRKDRLLTFEQMGIDDLTVDEAHEFKNLFYSSRLTNVKGMGNPSGSQKAFDLYSKVRVLRESPSGTVTFMTGTPISNSAVEMFTMMRYLAADELRELGLEHFDAWRSQFVSTDAGWEPTETGRLKEVNRLGRSWSNMRSLMDLYYSFTDSVGNEDIKKAYAEDNKGKQFPIPKVKGGDRQSVVVQPTPEQIKLLTDTMNEFDALPGIQDPYERNIARLKLMDRARKLSLDVRAAVPGHPSKEVGGKLDKISDEVKRIYDQWSDDKGTQLIFLDRSVPKSKGDDKIIKDYDALVLERNKAVAANDEDALRRATESLDKFDSNEVEELRASQAGGWNAYQQIKDNLIARGIPAGEIRFVQEANNDAQKQALFDQVKAGEVRVLIGSTPRMGAGTNVQDRLVALHHADVTWKPSDIEQREGRVIRQGNKLLDKYGIDNFEVEILAYATERTIDAKMWSLNSAKLKTINAIRNYDGSFSMDFDDDDSVSMAELAALASGNPMLLERVKLDSEINNLELLRKQHQRKTWGYVSRLEDAEKAIERATPDSERFTKLADQATIGATELAEDLAARSVTVEGETFTSYAEAAKAVTAEIVKQQAGDDKAKFSVKVGERRLTSQNGALDALSDALGDADPFLATVNGATYRGRTALAREVARLATDAAPDMTVGDSKVLATGKMLGFTFESSLSRSQYGGDYMVDMALVDADGKTVDAVTGRGQTDAKFVTSSLTNPLSKLSDSINPERFKSRARGAVQDAERAKRELPELREKAALPFSKEGELDGKRARLSQVIAELSTDKAPAAPEAAPEGDTPAMSRARPVFSRGAQSQANESVERLATGIASHWENAPKVVVAFDMNDPIIPENVRKEDQRQRSGGATGTPEGFYYKGVVYLMSSKLGTPNDVARVLFHEALGHAGLRGAFGGSLEPILREVSVMRRAEVDAKLKQYGLKGINKIDRLIAAEEVLAEMAQTRPEIGFVKRAIAAIRTWLRQNVPGFASLRLSDAELIRSFIIPARRFVEQGGGPKGGVRVEPTFSRGKDGKSNVLSKHGFFNAWPKFNSWTRAEYNDVVSLLPQEYRSDAHRAEPLSPKDRDARTAAALPEIKELNSGIGGAKGFGVDGLGNIVADMRDGVSTRDLIKAADIADKHGLGVFVTGVRTGSMPGLMDAGFVSEMGLGGVLARVTKSSAPVMPMASGVVNNTAYGTMMAYKPRGFAAPMFSRGTNDAVPAFDNASGNYNPDLDAFWLKKAAQEINGDGMPDAEYHQAIAEYANSWRVDSLLQELGWKRRGSSNISSSTYFTKDVGIGAFDEEYKSFEDYKTYEVRVSDHDDYHPADSSIEQRYQINFREGSEPWADADIGPDLSTAEALERLKDILPNESTAPDSGGAMFSRTLGDTLASATNNLVVADVGKKFGNRLADFRGMALQTLGRRQLVDIYAKDLPQLTAYSNMVAQMDADKNESGAEADALATEWGALDERPLGGLAKHPGMERKLAELMHDATLAQIDPDKEFVAGDDADQYQALRDGFEQLSPKAQAAYRKARGMYADHNEKVRQAIRERIERSELSSAKRKALLERMDGEFFQKVKGVYFPLARFGQYLTIVKDSNGTVLNVSRSETLNEADETRKILLKEYPASGGFAVGKVLKEKEFNAARDGVGRGFMSDLFETLEKTEAGEELIDSISQLYLAALPDLSWAKHGIHRKGTPGFSQDARRAFAQNMFHGARYLAKLRYADQLQTHLDDMQEHIGAKSADDGFDSVKAQQVADEMVKRHDSMMNPESHPISTALTSFGFVFHLGLSPASAMVNLSQTALVALPVMGAKWGFGKSSAALLTASKQAASNRNDISKVLKGDELRAYNEAVRSGVIDVTMAHDLAGIAQGEDSKVAAKVRPVMKWASFLFHHAEKFNRQVTFVAAYRLAREAGAEHSKAYADAVKATYDGHFDYSASNRARLLQGNWQKVILLFKQYAQNMIYTLSRQAYQAVKAGTPQERKEARKALSGLLVAHAMAAGVLGLPVVGILLSAASMVGGDDDEPWDAKVALQNMLADTLGQKPAEVIAHGLSRLTPWDISGRVGLDKLLLPDIQEGLSGTPAAQAMLASAAGPVAGIGVNMVKGLAEMGEGQYQRGLESMMPTALRGPLKAYRFAAEGNIDKTGVPINDEVSAAGIAGQALGLSPSETRLAQEGKSAIYSADRAVQARRSDLMRAYAMAAIDSDAEGMAEARQKIANFNERNPQSRIMLMQLMASVRARKKRIEESKQGVYLPKKRQDAMEAGRFAVVD